MKGPRETRPEIKKMQQPILHGLQTNEIVKLQQIQNMHGGYKLVVRLKTCAHIQSFKWNGYTHNN